MPFTRFSDNLNIISNLANRPNRAGMSAAQLKAKFDEGENRIKTFINNFLNELESISSAGNIGISPPEGMTAATVQQAVEELAEGLEASKTHAERHAAQGADPITVSTGNLDDGSVTRPKLAAGSTHSTLSLSLLHTAWTDKQQTVAAAGVREDSTLIVAPAPGSHEEYCAAGVYATAQGADSLTFTCDYVPETVLTVNVGVLR